MTSLGVEKGLKTVIWVTPYEHSYLKPFPTGDSAHKEPHSWQMWEMDTITVRVHPREGLWGALLCAFKFSPATGLCHDLGLLRLSAQ